MSEIKNIYKFLNRFTFLKSFILPVVLTTAFSRARIEEDVLDILVKEYTGFGMV